MAQEWVRRCAAKCKLSEPGVETQATETKLFLQTNNTPAQGLRTPSEQSEVPGDHRQQVP